MFTTFFTPNSSHFYHNEEIKLTIGGKVKSNPLDVVCVNTLTVVVSGITVVGTVCSVLVINDFGTVEYPC